MKKNRKVIAIHQPDYLPWLGYFYKISQTDIFVFLDDAQFSNEGAHNYHYIKTPQGTFRLKVPVIQSLGNKINEVKTRDDLGWKKKHLQSIEANYKKAPFFKEVFEPFAQILNKQYDTIADLNESIILFFCQELGIKTQFVKASELDVNSKREERVIDICCKLEGTIYYSGTGAKAYQVEDNFKAKGLELVYSNFKPFPYAQLWGEFHHNVSIIDFVMNNGYNWDLVMDKFQNNK
jgi:hypothetical protein